MPIIDIPINKGVYKTQSEQGIRNSEFADDLVNLFIDDAGTNFDRPTLQLFATLPSIDPIGMVYFDDSLVVVTADRCIYRIQNDATITDITGVKLGGIARPTFADNGSTLFIVGGGLPIKWDGEGATTEVLGGSPPEMTHILALDGYLIGNRRLGSENNKVIQFSGVDLPESWSALDIFSAVSDPDEVTALVKSQRDLYVVGEDTTELWQNVGSIPIPFNRAYVYQLGTSAADSVWSVDNSVFFLDQNRRIIRIVGRTPQVISSGIEKSLSEYESVADCFTSSFNYKSSVHVLFSFPSAGEAWSIDLKNSNWTRWTGYDNGEARVRINCVWHEATNNTTYAGDFNTGKIWKFSDTIKEDAGSVFPRIRRFTSRDVGASISKKANWVRVNLDRNVASAHEGEVEETNPILELRWKDHGKQWVDWRQASLGEIGNQKQFAEFRRLGVYRKRQYEVRFTDPSNLRMVSVETDEEGLTP